MSSNRVKFCPKKQTIQSVKLDNIINSFDNNLKVTVCEKKFNSISSAKDQIKHSVKSNKFIQYEKFDDSFNNVVSQINTMAITEKNKDIVYCVLNNMVDSFHKLATGILDYSEVDARISEAKNYVSSKICALKSSYKRKKQLQIHKNYVEPIEMAVGQKWKTKHDLQSHLPDYTLAQTTFQYIPILKTLQSLFSQDEFKQIYFQYNSNESHVCADGVYERFCCSEIAKNSELFSDNNAIRIRVATDDVDLCDANKSKKTIHKLTAVYFTIDNLPPKHSSKLDNIFLVALCETINLKSITFDEIALHIVNEMKELETVGIMVDGRILKGGLALFASDNLGANGSLGFVESFNSFFCRWCEISKSDSMYATTEMIFVTVEKVLSIKLLKALNEHVYSMTLIVSMFYRM